MGRQGDGDRPRRPGKKVRIELRKNRAKPPRDKTEWTRKIREGDTHLDESAQVENVRSKGDLSRKRTIIVGEPDAAGLCEGVVINMRGLVAEVDDGRAVWACTVRRMLRTRQIEDRHPVVVGDRVKFIAVQAGGEGSRFVSEERNLQEGVIEEVVPRKTMLARQYERRVQAVAANVDVVVIVAASDAPTLRPHLVDRYLVSIHKGGMRPMVCINKADLDADGFAAEVAGRYAALGYRSIISCVEDGRGLEELREMVRGVTSAFVGQSGVGKSSLLNALEPGFSLKVGTLTDLDRGKHTTTTARLLRWSFGGYVVDTPGIRQFDLAGVSAEELDDCFVEFMELIPRCKFAGCSHTHEIGCAVKQAVEEGKITSERYDSYCKMYAECAEKSRY